MLNDRYQDNFNLIRLIAALMVLVGHGFIVMGDNIPTFLGIEISVFGVMVFFSISGYLVAESWIRDPSVMRYLARRSLRIFPALIVLVLLTTFLLGPLLTNLSLKDYFTSIETYAYLENIFLSLHLSLPGVFENNPQHLKINLSLWSLNVEFLMYLLLPVILLFKGRRNGLIFAIITILLSITLTFLQIHVLGGGGRRGYLGDFNLTKEARFFMAGVAMRYIMGGKVIPLAWASSIFIFTVGVYYLSSFNYYFFNILLAFALPCFINTFGESSEVRLPGLNKLGDISYGVYLYAFPIQQIIAQFFIGKISVLTSIIFATIPTVFIAYLSWHLIEKNALTLKPTIKKNQTKASGF